MTSDQDLLLDSPMKVRREREWIYLRLKEKVAATGTIQLSELNKLERLLEKNRIVDGRRLAIPSRYRDLKVQPA